MNFILHSDLNCFYASVEMIENSDLKDKPLAVCGSAQDRHGIVLTKNYLAKPYGIKTGEANWQAKQKCPGLVIVPPHYDLYLRYSAVVRQIYSRFTPQIEPFGMDECWLSLTGLSSIREAEAIAESIRQTIKTETGLTVSIGVSFSKIFAKLGSDMKKPDAITVISRENYQSLVYPLPVSQLLYVGPATARRLRFHNVYTIGELAGTGEGMIRSWLGKNGVMLRAFALGCDGSAVQPYAYTAPIKSIGHGATCVRDLETNYEVWLCILALCQDIGRRLKDHSFRSSCIELSVRDKELQFYTWQRRIDHLTQSPVDIAHIAYGIFHDHYPWIKSVRAITVRAVNLSDSEGMCVQTDLFGLGLHREKMDRYEDAVYQLRSRFGDGILKSAASLCTAPLATDRCEIVPMPGMMYR